MPDRIKSMFSFIKKDSFLKPYKKIIRRRFYNIIEKEKILLSDSCKSLADFASGHEYFGLHFRNGEWIFREWAPNASAVFLIGEMTAWKEKEAFSLRRINKDGVWEIRLSGAALKHNDLYRLKIYWDSGHGDRLPAYARRIVQDPHTNIFNAQVWKPEKPYVWKAGNFSRSPEPPIIYEIHIGMAQEADRIGTYKEFTINIIPKIIKSGYNVIQIMAVQEHPYYASFGYQASNFFAASSRFGTPEELKELIDCAHEAGISVIMDLIHSHSVANEVEGLSRFDGTLYQYFHEGNRGHHELWDSRCFDYNKHQVLHFLLSNCRFWLDEYKFDGFRFDGVTSMIYKHHGIGKDFMSYEDYFDENVDEDALTYLALANKLIHEIKPDSITLAEDVSGMPGLAVPLGDGGIGFDFRFAMGIPDYWIKLVKDAKDEDWPMGKLWHELTNTRKDEKTLSYAESHDQALVGDQTLIFRLIGEDIYDNMHIFKRNLKVERGLALHKMIRLATIATAGNGYLNFMGNEFGHPEWIDFPRQGNNWSYKYAKRQWSLADDKSLYYGFLMEFDRAMIAFAKNFNLLKYPGPGLLYDRDLEKTLIFLRGDLLFAFNFHPAKSYSDYIFETLPGKYKMILDTDERRFGGHGRLAQNQEHFTLFRQKGNKRKNLLSLYMPARCALVLKLER